MLSVPEEIHHEILLRLPVESLFICKRVCKNWYALISTSNFVKSHLNFTIQKNSPILMVEGYDSNILYSIAYASLESSVCRIEDNAIDMNYPFKSLDYDVRLMVSCNGIICIWLFDYEGDTEFLCLWNPATREYKEIPKSPNELNSCNVRIRAFGYDCKTDDYKLVIGVKAHGSKDSTLVQVYSLVSNSWKTGQVIPYRVPYMQISGVLVNGDFHWLATAQSKFLLLSFNISDESFKKMQLPEELSKKSKDMFLGVLEWCLCVLASSFVNGVKIHFEVWEMLDYGVLESWTRRYIITYESIVKDHRYLRLMWSFENGKILFLSSGSLVLYDPEHGSGRELNIRDISFTDSVNYFETLVSLKSGTYVGGEARMEELRGET